MGSLSLAKLERSRPAQNPRPSPDTTTARSSSKVFNSSIAAQIASNIAGSSAFILSARVNVTWAMWADTLTATRSDILFSAF